MLSRNEMETVIRKGGTILHNGQMISRIEDLPSQGDLATGDQAKLKTELARLDAQAADLAGQRAKVIASLNLAEEDAHRTEETAKNAAKPKQPVKTPTPAPVFPPKA